jgi:hypothetical protein
MMSSIKQQNPGIREPILPEDIQPASPSSGKPDGVPFELQELLEQTEELPEPLGDRVNVHQSMNTSLTLNGNRDQQKPNVSGPPLNP